MSSRRRGDRGHVRADDALACRHRLVAAVRWPNGMIAVTDDWHHRIVVIDPSTKQIVWSFGHDGSRAAGRRLPLQAGRPRPASATVTRTPAANARAVRRIGSLPSSDVSGEAQSLCRAAGILVAGGLVGGLFDCLDPRRSTRPPSGRSGQVAVAPGHDAAAALLGGAVDVFGGGQATSTNAVVPDRPRDGPLDGHLHLRRAAVGPRGRRSSDRGSISSAGTPRGGVATAVLRYLGSGRTAVAARLPVGLRYAGVAAIGNTIYVAGGLTPSGETTDVLAIVPSTGRVRRIATLPSRGPTKHSSPSTATCC